MKNLFTFLLIGTLCTNLTLGQTDKLKIFGESLKDSSITTTIYKGAIVTEDSNTASKVLFVLPEDRIVELLEYNNLHYKIHIDSFSGYIEKGWVFPNMELTNFIQSYKNIKDEIDAAENLKNINLKNEDLEKRRIIINRISITNIDSANGVDFSIEWRYYDKSKVIKYIYFTVVPYNEVGDIQKGTIRKYSTFTGKITGPIKASFDFRNPTWGTAWYNNTISCIKLTKVKVEYMDGTSYTYVNELSKILDSDFKNDCRYK